VPKSKIEFQTQYSRRFDSPVRFRTATGSREAVTYEPVYDRKGVWHLAETGKENRYLDIQSYAASCDINVIMARYRNGETDVLQQIQGTYGDFSNVPTNYADLMNAKLQAEHLFMSLSADVREKYNNSVEQFMAEIGTREGMEKLGISFEQTKSEQESEVSSDGT